MQFNQIQRKNVMQAIAIGAVFGLIGVGIFIYILQFTTPAEEQVTVDSQPDQEIDKVTLYASQHGLFSTQEAAEAYMSEFPSLNLATVVEIEGQFYVWSELSTTNQWEKAAAIPTSFIKTVYFSSVGCSDEKKKLVPSKMLDDAYFDIQQLASLQDETIPEKWPEIVTSFNNLTKNNKIVRLHVMQQLAKEEACLHITLN